jgi:hypothetical protein
MRVQTAYLFICGKQSPLNCILCFYFENIGHFMAATAAERIGVEIAQSHS